MHGIELDLTQTHFVKTRGEFTIYGSWVGDQNRPCLAILPSMREGMPLVIKVDDAWKWNPDDKTLITDAFTFMDHKTKESQPERCARLIGAFLFANDFRGSNSFTCMKVVSIIHDHLGDLLKIPPKALSLEVVADAYRTDDSGKVHHTEIRAAK